MRDQGAGDRLGLGGLLAVAGPVDTLVLRALGLGDLLTAVPALRAVRRGIGGRVVLAASTGLAPLALHTGAVDEVVDTVGLAPLDPALHGAAVAVNLHGRGPQSTSLLRATGPGRLLAYDVEGGPVWDPAEHERDRWCRLLTSCGLPADPDDLDLAPPDVEPLARAAVLVHPGAAYASRRWPAGRWAAVARELARRGEQVLVTGSADERDLAGEVADRAGLVSSSVLAGRTGLLHLAGLVAASRLLLCADTGIAHLATAVGTPSVVLFGPASPARWRPPPSRTQHRVLWSGREGDVFAATPDPGLLTITCPDVLAEATAALAG